MKTDKPSSKEERLAEALRANLRRRKTAKQDVLKDSALRSETGGQAED